MHKCVESIRKNHLLHKSQLLLNHQDIINISAKDFKLGSVGVPHLFFLD